MVPGFKLDKKTSREGDHTSPNCQRIPQKGLIFREDKHYQWTLNLLWEI
jgi:hypothetical protein